MASEQKDRDEDFETWWNQDGWTLGIPEADARAVWCAARARAPGWVIVHEDDKRWRTLDSTGMPDWTSDPNDALCFSLRKHADLFAQDDPEPVHIRSRSPHKEVA